MLKWNKDLIHDKSKVRGMRMSIKQVSIGIVVTSLFFISVLIYNHRQLPTIDDVFTTTKNWSPATEEVYLLTEIDGKWITIFRNQQSMKVGELKQNWFGLWRLQDEMGREESLASTYYPPEKEDEITWSVLGVGEKEIVYYFGQVINPEIQKITIENNGGSAEEAQFISSNGNRFFFKKVMGQYGYPINIKALSKSGELIYSTLPKY